MSVGSLSKKKKKLQQFLIWTSTPVIYSSVEQALPFTWHIKLLFCNRGCYRQSIFGDENGVLHLVYVAQHSS